MSARRVERAAASPYVWIGSLVVAVISVVTRWWAFPRYDTRTHGAELAQAVSASSVLVCAYLLARRHPDNPMWALTLCFGLAGLIQDFFGPNRLLWTIGLAASEWPAVFLVWLSLAYPTGHLRSRLDRVLLAWVWAVAAIAAARMFTERSNFPVWRSLLAIDAWHAKTSDIEQVALYGALPAGLVFLGRLITRAISARRGPRRVSMPLLVAAIGATIWFLAQVPFVGRSGFARAIIDDFYWFSLLIQASIPIAFAIGALTGRWSRSVVAALMIELDGAPPGAVQPALAHVLRDPELEVLLRRPDGSGFVRPDGTPIAWEAANVPASRSWTPIGADAHEVGVVVYDAELDAEPDLIRSTIAAARFALENERLHADLQAQMIELRASRTRVVEAADAERRKIERNLHDGVQQRLYTVGMELDRARQAAADRDDDTVLGEHLEQVDAALRTAIEDLRDVARGIDPPVLINRGLEAALRSHTRRSPVPVVITNALTTRLSAPIETATYYVASEAFLNAVRHAQASRITIELRGIDGELVVAIVDDGVGGADEHRGTGLRGLRDRADALDGTLRIDSPLGAGTRIELRLPLDGR